MLNYFKKGEHVIGEESYETQKQRGNGELSSSLNAIAYVLHLMKSLSRENANGLWRDLHVRALGQVSLQFQLKRMLNQIKGDGESVPKNHTLIGLKTD